jgi:Cu(I)/Ag(I) efflux system membrane fusion protein
MHPEIIRDKPGDCPICGMPLVKKEEKAEAIKDVPLEALLRPTNEFVLSSVPVTIMQQSNEQTTINGLGTVTYDNREIATVSSRIEGRIERMYVRYRYQFINRGDKILDIYSPELVNSQENLIFLLRLDAANTSLINAAKQRLLLLGMGSQQLAQIMKTGKPFYSVSVYSNYAGYVNELGFNGANSDNQSMNAGSENMSANTSNYNQTTQELSLKEGMYVQKGQAVLTVINPIRALVLLSIFSDQQNSIKQGTAVIITPEGAPLKKFAARIDLIDPFYRPESKTLTARVYFNNTSRIPIGSQVQATILTEAPAAYWLPSTAVVTLGINNVVFRKEGEGFRAHKVTTGTKLNDKIQIVSGLSATDSVAVNGQFLIGSESFIKVSQ